MKNLILFCVGLVGAFSTAAHAELVNVVCTGTRGEETKAFEYLVDTSAPLKDFIGADVSTWTLTGEMLVAMTTRDEQIVMDNETNLVRYNGELMDKERMSCSWDVAETTTSAPNDDALSDITKRLDEIDKRLSTLESLQ